MSEQFLQIHPQEHKDKEIIDSLLDQSPTNDNLTELARLEIRYLNFPGAKEIQNNIKQIMDNWGLSKEELYEKTREIYGKKKKASSHFGEIEQEDWS